MVAGDAEDPGSEGLLEVVALQRRVGAREGLLGGVAGLLRVGEEAEAQAVDRPLVLLDEPREGLAVAAGRGEGEACIVGWGRQEEPFDLLRRGPGEAGTYPRECVGCNHANPYGRGNGLFQRDQAP